MTTIKHTVLMIACFIILLPFLSFAAEVDLPKTGQITCYDESGNVILCPDTGQDGDIQAGVDWPEPRFEDNGNGTVTDHLTGLIWLKNANCAGSMNWNSALTYCNNLASGTCGLTDGSVAGDWRLPNVVELESLVDAEAANTAVWLNTQGFSSVQSSYYWSATTYANSTNYAWYILMGYGRVGYSGKSDGRYVWPVRAGQ